MSSASIWAVAGDAGIRSVLLCSTWAERAKVAIVSVTESEASRSNFRPCASGVRIINKIDRGISTSIHATMSLTMGVSSTT
jgi:hypothetical protein